MGPFFNGSAYDSLLEGIQILTAEWRYLYVNPAAEIQNRRPTAELLGRTYQECWPGVESTPVFPFLRDCMVHRKPASMENHFVFPDGHSGWYELRVQPSAEGIFILSYDITPRKTAEQQALQMQRLYAALSQVNQIILRTSNREELFVSICQVAVRFARVSAAWIGLVDGVTGRLQPVASEGRDKVNPPTQPDKTQVVEGITALALETGEVQTTGETSTPGDAFPSSAVVPFHYRGTVLGVLTLLAEEPGAFGSGAEVQLLQEMALDVSFALENLEKEKEKKEAERLQRQWADAFEHCAHGIVIGSPLDNTILTCNPAFAAQHRTTMKALEGTPVAAMYPREEWPRIRRFLEESDRTGKVSFDARKIRADGTGFDAHLDLVSVRDTSGNLLYRVATENDVTDRNLLQAQLLQSQKLESLGTLSSGIAHDFNNLLSIILGNASLLTQTPVDPARIPKRVDAIVRASSRGADLVRQLLTFARKNVAHFHPVALNDLVADTITLLGETFPKSIKIVFRPQAGVGEIGADATQIHQVLLNLCVNARDAMPDGGTLTVATSVDEGGQIVLEVADTGVGMDDATLSRIFEPFFTTKERGKGTGLGLSTVFGLMESHHGTVSVHSQPGRGTTFRCAFPPLSPAEARRATVEEMTPVEVRHGHETILIVEDEQLIRHLLKDFLEGQGYRVLTAGGGQRALDLFTEHRDSIALVISDLGLPGMGGDELFRRLIRINPDLRLILTSGYFEKEKEEALRREGLRVFLPKPYALDEILLIIRKALP